MCGESVAIGDSEIEKMLGGLIKDYGMDASSLSRLLGVDKSTVENYHNHESGLASDFSKRCSFMNRLLMLYNTPNEEPDRKVRAFLEVLIYEHQLSAGTIARFARIEEQDVLHFLKDGTSVPVETKYRLASAVMTLRFLFKDAEPVF